MKELNYYQFGFMIGAIALFTLALILLLTSVLRGSRSKTNYDERQVLARNKAYKYSFMVLLLYCCVCAILGIIDIKWATLPTMLFMGVMISVLVFAEICIVRDAYVGIDNRKTKSAFIFISLYNLASFIMMLSKGLPLIEDGMLTERVLPLFLSVLFGSVVITQLIKNEIDKKAADE